MAPRHTIETFIRLPEVERRDWSIPAVLYNRCRLFLSRSDTGSVFIPIRTMQFIAVVDRQEIIFVDSQGGYVQHQGEGGRPILISWLELGVNERSSLDASIPCQVVFYDSGLMDVQRRLVSELGPALGRMEEKYRHGNLPPRDAQIVSLPGP